MVHISGCRDVDKYEVDYLSILLNVILSFEDVLIVIQEDWIRVAG